MGEEVILISESRGRPELLTDIEECCSVSVVDERPGKEMSEGMEDIILLNGNVF